MKCLVTGSAGLVGRHIAQALRDRGDTVTGVDNLCSESSIRPASIENFYETDCRDFFKACDEQFDYVFHCAAVVGGRAKIEGEPIAVADDLSIDSAMWQWAVRTKQKKIINFSSSAVYPVMDQIEGSHRLLKESDISFGDSDLGLPDMSYGWAKLTSEYLGKLAYEKHGIKSVVYRPFSGYGEDQHTSYPFPNLMNQFIKGRAIEVWGTGEQMRDFIHIDDCVRGVLETMEKIDDGSALNLSTGVYTSFNNLIRIAGSSWLLGERIKILPQLDKPVGVHARAGDTTKQREYGFTPRISLREGIERYITAHI